jgi:hypothetical protein
VAKPIRVTILLLLTCLAYTTYAQLNYDFTKGKFLIKGQVVDLQSKEAIPFANVRITNNGKAVTCDNQGYFTLYVAPNDTLSFSSTGYLTKVKHVYDIDSNSYYTMQIELIRDFVKLKSVTIYPFKDKKEFTDAFMAAKDINKITLPGVAPPKYSNVIPKAKLSNPVSFLYDKLKRKRSANPDFKP